MAVAFVRSHTLFSEKILDASAEPVIAGTSVAAGNLLVLVIEFDNAGTASKPTIAAGTSIARAAGETNTWQFLGAARSTSTSIGAFSSGEMWAIKTTVAWPSGAYTVTLDTSVTQKAAIFLEFSGADATLRSTSGTNYSTTTTAASATTTGTTPSTGDLALGFTFGSNVAAAQAGDTDTTGGSWSTPVGVGSTGGSGASNNFGIAQYKILTSASHQTFNNSAAMTAGNGAIVAILQATIQPLVTQAAYRMYADGTETGSTALATQDTAATVDTSGGDANIQLRTRLQETAGGVVPATTDWQLQWMRGDDYPVSNATGTLGYLASAQTQFAQSFIGPGGPLTQATFWLYKSLTVTGTISAALWAHDGGTFGGTGLPTGSPLATSTTTVTASTLPTTAAATPFTFDGTVTMTPGTPYFIGLIATGAGPRASGEVDMVRGTASHPGKPAVFTTGWATTSTNDLIFEVGTWTDVASVGVESLAHSYPTSNQDSFTNVTASGGEVGQSFLGDGKELSRVRFYLAKGGSPTGTVVARLYAHTGTFGTGTGLPTGSPLATSATVNIATLTTSYVMTDFTFDGTFTLQSGTPYYVVWSPTGFLDLTNYVRQGEDDSSATHPGTLAVNSAGSWSGFASYDTCFELYTATVASTVLPYASANLTDAAATTNRLTGGTGTFVAGKVSEDGLVDDLGWSASNYTELLYSVTLKQADLTASDTLRFRVLKNGAATDLTYTQVPTVTIGSAGPTTWNVTADLPVTVGFGAGIARTTEVGASLTVTSSFTAGATRTQPVAAANLQIGVSLAGAVDRTQPVAAPLAVSVAGTAAVDRTATVAFTTPVTVTLAAAAVQAGAVNIAFTTPVTVTGLAAADRTATIAATLPVTVTGLAAATRTQLAAANALTVTVTGLAAADRVTGIAATLPVTVTGLAAATRTQFVTANALAVTVTGLAAADRTVGIAFTLPVTVTGVAAVERTQFVTANSLTVTVTGLAAADRMAAIAFTLPVTMTGLAAAERTQFVTATSLTVTVTGLAAAVQTGAAAVAFTLSVTASTGGAMALTALVTAAPLTVTVATAGALLRTVGVAADLAVTVNRTAAAAYTGAATFTLPVTVTGLAAVTRTVGIMFTLPVTVTGLAAVDRTAGIAFTLPVTVTGVAAVGRTQLATVNALPVTVGLVAVAVPTGALAGAFALSIAATGTAGADRVATIAATLPVTVSLTGALLRTVGVAAPLGVTVTGLVTADRVAAITFTLPVTVTGLAAASPVGATGFTLPVTATTSGAVLRTVGVTFTLPVTVTGLVTADRVATIAATLPVTVAITGGFVTSIAVTRTITVGLSAGGIRTQPLATTLAVAASVVAGATREQPAGSTLALTAVLSAGAARSQFPTTSLVVTATTVFGGTVTHAYTVAFALVVTMSSTGTLPALVRDILVAAQVIRHWSSTVVGNDDRAGMVDAGRSASGVSSGRYTRAVSTREARVTE